MIIRKSNKIPVRQDGAETPPALGVENSSDGSSTPTHASANVERGQGEGVILPLSPDFHNSPARESLIASERGNPFLHDLANETRPVFGRHLVVPFNIITFHGGSCGD